MDKLVLFVIVLRLAAASSRAMAQADMTAMTTMDEQCHATIETQAIACQPVGTLVEFANGRSILLFSAEGTLYSFSGSRLEERGSNTFALIIDTVRIASESAPERDLTDVLGECVIKIEPQRGRLTTIECNALSRGRDAHYRLVLDRIANVDRKKLR
jgi:hypothetical protein